MDATCPKAKAKPKPKAPRRQKTGFRCMVEGCSNSNSDGYSIHHMLGEKPSEGQPYTSTQTAWIDFIGRKKKFTVEDAREYKQITICGGHFDEEQYERTQVQMYKMGIRRQRPRLEKGAVPTIDVVKNPFPPDYLVRKGIVGSNQQSSSSAGMSLTAAASSSTNSSAIPTMVLQSTSLQVVQQDLDHIGQLQQQESKEFHAIHVEYVEDDEEDRPGERAEEDRPWERAEEDRPGERAEEDRPWERAEDDRPGERVRVEDTFDHSRGKLHAVKLFPPNSESSLTSSTECTSGSSVSVAKPSDKQDKLDLMLKNKSGLTCVLNGCDNTWYQGFSINEMPRKKGCTRQGWIEFIKNSRSDFNPNDRKRVHLCSGHFDPSQYEQSQLRSFQHGIRSQPPQLLPTAVPHFKEAVQPFPLEWFVGAHVQAEVQRKRSLMSSSALYHVDDIATTQVAKAGGRREGRHSIYSRKQEVARILDMYDKNEKEKLKAEEARRSIAVNKGKKRQSALSKVSNTSQAKKYVITGGKQEEPNSHAKDHVDGKNVTDVSENQESLQEDRNQTNFDDDPDAAYSKLHSVKMVSNASQAEKYVITWGKQEEPNSHAEDHLDGKNMTDVSENQELLQEDGNQTNQSDDPNDPDDHDAVYIMYVEEEAPASDDDNGFGEHEVQEALLQEAANQTREGDTVEMFMDGEEFSGTGMGENREEQVLLEEDSNQSDNIDDENCVQVCLNLLRREVVPSSCPILKSTTASTSSCSDLGAKYFDMRDHQYHITCKKQHKWSCVLHGCNNTNSGYRGFSIYEMPKEKGPTRRGWIEFIKTSNPDFNPYYRRRVHLCSGHFERSQYVQSQLRSFQRGIRRHFPRLIPTAVPHLRQAVQPFPLDWFVDAEVQAEVKRKRRSAANHDDVPTRQVEKTQKRMKRPVPTNSRKKIVTPKSQHQAEVCGKQRNQISLLEDPITVYIKEEVLSSDDDEEAVDGFVTIDGQQALSQEESNQIEKEDAVDISMMKEPSCSGADLGENGEERSSLKKDGNETEYFAADDLVEVGLKEAIPSSSDTKVLCAVHSSPLNTAFNGDCSDVSQPPCLATTLDDSNQPTPVSTPDGIDQNNQDENSDDDDGDGWINEEDTLPSGDEEELCREREISASQDREAVKGDINSSKRMTNLRGHLQCEERTSEDTVASAERIDHQVTSTGKTSQHEQPSDCNAKDLTMPDVRIPERKKSFVCSYCSKEKSSQSRLDRHIRIHTEEKPFQCSFCHERFVFTKHLKRHIRVHSGERPQQYNDSGEKPAHKTDLAPIKRTKLGKPPYQCDYCSKIITVKNTFILHLRTHTGEKPYQCDHCSRKFAQRSVLVRHMRIHSENKPYQCANCGMRFRLKTTLTGHIRTHTGEKPFKCHYCSEKFTHQTTFIRHVRTHTGEKPYECDHCCKKFVQNSNLKQHMKTHTGEGPYQCRYCSKVVVHKKAFGRHMKTHTRERPYQCDHCCKKFSHKSKFDQHMRTHTGNKPYPCAYCSMRFTLPANLTMHIRTHTGEKPYQCEHCSKKFAQKSGLVRHVGIHTETKPYQCPNCSMRFGQKATLADHLRTHTGEKPFQCDDCNMRFTRMTSLSRHRRTHTGEKPFQCDVCSRAFADKWNLTCHMKTHIERKTISAAADPGF